MNQVIEFQKKHGNEVRAFLSTEAARAWMQLLASLRGRGNYNALTEHQVVQAYGEMMGYERAIQNMVTVCTEWPEVPAPQANYGVTPKKQEDDPPN